MALGLYSIEIINPPGTSAPRLSEGLGHVNPYRGGFTHREAIGTQEMPLTIGFDHIVI